MSNLRKLEINDKEVYFTSAEGKWWVAVKPICDALGVDYSRQLRTLKEDNVLGDAWSLQTMHDTLGRQQKMAALPEFFVYGWIFQIQSDSPMLQQYKWKCYEVLHNYFHGTANQRSEQLKERVLLQREITKVKEELETLPQYKRLQELEKQSKQKSYELKALDNAVVGQLDLFGEEEKAEGDGKEA